MKKTVMTWMLGCTLTMLSLPLLAQEANLLKLIAEKQIPMNLPLKNLNSDWLSLQIRLQGGDAKSSDDMMSKLMQLGAMSGGSSGSNPGEEALGMMFLSSIFGGGGSGSAPTTYYTQGQTVQLGGETFLIVYSLPAQSMDFSKLMTEAMASEDSGEEPDMSAMLGSGKLTPESEVSLSLLNMKAIASFQNLRAFDMQRELEESFKSNSWLETLMQAADGAEAMGNLAEEVETEPLSAEEMREILGESLMQTYRTDAQLGKTGNNITVSVQGERVILRGVVTSDQMKARATNLARQGIKSFGFDYKVVNEITVRK